jgi:pimeloyl-ACP methyl ester carboxylesterase
MPWILRYRFDNRVYVKTIEANTYLFASKDDRVTPIQSARNLASFVKNLAYYEEFRDLDHKEILWHEAVIQKINLHLKEEKEF